MMRSYDEQHPLRGTSSEQHEGHMDVDEAADALAQEAAARDPEATQDPTTTQQQLLHEQHLLLQLAANNPLPLRRPLERAPYWEDLLGQQRRAEQQWLTQQQNRPQEQQQQPPPTYHTNVCLLCRAAPAAQANVVLWHADCAHACVCLGCFESEEGIPDNPRGTRHSACCPACRGGVIEARQGERSLGRPLQDLQHWLDPHGFLGDLAEWGILWRADYTWISPWSLQARAIHPTSSSPPSPGGGPPAPPQ